MRGDLSRCEIEFQPASFCLGDNPNELFLGQFASVLDIQERDQSFIALQCSPHFVEVERLRPSQPDVLREVLIETLLQRAQSSRESRDRFASDFRRWCIGSAYCGEQTRFRGPTLSEQILLLAHSFRKPAR